MLGFGEMALMSALFVLETAAHLSVKGFRMACLVLPCITALMARSVFNDLLSFAEKMAPSLPFLTIPDKVNHFNTAQVKIWCETRITASPTSNAADTLLLLLQT